MTKASDIPIPSTACAYFAAERIHVAQAGVNYVSVWLSLRLVMKQNFIYIAQHETG
jgi:hypothetical protein